MNSDEIVKFQNMQRDTVAKMGAFVSCLDSYSIFLDEPDYLNNEISEIRRLQPIVGEFMTRTREIYSFLNEFHYASYYQTIVSSTTNISFLLANQTMPSTHIGISDFRGGFELAKNSISEAMVAIAQIASSPVDINLVAGNSFSAYCFIKSIINTTRSELIIVDPYLDGTLFYRYFCELHKDISIILVTDSRKLKNDKLKKFEAVEVVFKKEHPKYFRKMHDNLHDRYLINEVNAYSLGGSIVHAAYKSDFSVVELSNEKREELLEKYA